MVNPGPLWKCECSKCNCENAAVKEHPDTPAVCYQCDQGEHKAEREWRKTQEKKDD